jgi:ribulose-phosphate 3-epimerase
MIKVYPSLLSCDFGKLRDEIISVEKAGADGIHVDVMDSHFVPNLTFGAPVINCIKNDVKTLLDCHLMVTNPDLLIEDFAKAGAKIITVHQETCPHLQRTLKLIRSFGCKAGVSINPATSYQGLEWVLDDVDMILSMTVNPGFGGQHLIPAALEKTKEMKNWLSQKGRHQIPIQIDGGVNKVTAKLAKSYGVDILVAGSAIFNSSNYSQAIAELKS